MRTLAILLGIALLAAPRPSPARDGSAEFAPYEDLLEVLALHAWHLDHDLYRFPAPTDPAGHDVNLLTLRRLETWRQRFPGRMDDVVFFARAQALERLRAYDGARADYARVAEDDHSTLQARARVAAARAARFAEVDALPEVAPTLQATLDLLAVKLDRWREVHDGYPQPPYPALALLETERLEARVSRILVDRQADIGDGTATAERALRALIERHGDSRALPEHVLRLGDFYADLAERYLATHDRPLAFEREVFVDLTDRALDAYQKIATWDGVAEKPIARGRFDALEARRDAALERHK